MTWLAILTWAIEDTWLLIQGWEVGSWTTVITDFSAPMIDAWWVSWAFTMLKDMVLGFLSALRPLIKLLLILIVILALLYIWALWFSGRLASKQRKKVQADIPDDYKEYKEVGSKVVIENMLDYGSVYDPEYEKMLEEEAINENTPPDSDVIVLDDVE